MKPVEISAFRGVNNVSEPDRLRTGELVTAANFDLDMAGKLLRRKEYVQISTGAAHSMWGNGDTAYFVQGGQLRSLQPDGTVTDIVPCNGPRVIYGAIGDKVFWMDGITRGVIEAGNPAPWGFDVPILAYPSPIIGGMPRGTYALTTTFIDSRGNESGAARRVRITLGEDRGINVTLPTAAVGVSHHRIYMTATDGAVPMLAATVPIGTGSFSILTLPPLTMPCETEFLSPPPQGSCIEMFNGRCYLALDNFLLMSQPFEPELFDLRAGFITFPDKVQTVVAVTDGLFVGTKTKTYFLDGSDEPSLRTVSEYGTVPGTAVRLDPSVDDKTGGRSVAWLSSAGVMRGSPGGSVVNLTANKFIPPTCSTGSAVVKRRGDTPQYLVSIT